MKNDNNIFLIKNNLSSILPFWNNLQDIDKDLLINSAQYINCKTNDIIHDADGVSPSLIIIVNGRLRSTYQYNQNKKITLYWLYKSDVCVLCANSVLLDIPFHVTIIAEEKSEIIKIPAKTFLYVQEKYNSVADYTRTLMTERFSDILWLIDQVTFSPFKKNLASYLIEKYSQTSKKIIDLTQQQIADDLGVARSLVAMTLKDFENLGLIQLIRGGILIKDHSLLLKESN